MTQDLQGEYLQNLSREDLETLMQLGGLSVPQLMGEVMVFDWSGRLRFLFQVKRLQNIAYQLGQEETKEMTRGKYLNILRCIDFLEMAFFHWAVSYEPL